MEPIHLDALLRLLALSWLDIDYRYEGLTEIERAQISKEEFDSTVRLMESRGIIGLGLEPA